MNQLVVAFSSADKMVTIVETISWYFVRLWECEEAMYAATKIIFHTCTPERRHFSLLCVLYVLAVRDETKQLETYTTKTKKTGVKKYRYHVCSQACWEFLQTYITLNIDNYCASTWIFLNVLFYWRFYRLSWKQKACMVLRCLILITRKLWNFCLTWVDEGKSVKEFLGYGEIASVLFSYRKQNNCGN